MFDYTRHRPHRKIDIYTIFSFNKRSRPQSNGATVPISNSDRKYASPMSGESSCVNFLGENTKISSEFAYQRRDS